MKQKLPFLSLLTGCLLFFNFLSAQTSVFINELHYENASGDVNEGVEIAGPAGTDLTGWSLVMYNGSSTQLKVDFTVDLTGTIPDSQNGYGFLNFATTGIQNGSPDGLALVDAANHVVQFLSYEGTFTPVDGPAAGMESTDIGVEEGVSTPADFSLQLAGSGTMYEYFTWQPEAASTFGAVNNDQAFGNSTSEELAFINEIHYDNISEDTGEGVEIAGPAGTDLSLYSIEIYNGGDAMSDGPVALSGIIPDKQGGYGMIFFPISGLQNGSPDGFALVKDGTTVVQFLSYEGSFTAVDGPAAGLESTDISVEESNSSTPAGYSLQLGGSGTKYSDFTWQEALPSTYDEINQNQDFGGAVTPVTVFINEVDSDTEGTDGLEFVELYDGGVGNTSLDGKVIVFYNGSNSESYMSYDLDGYSTNANGYFVLGDADVANVDFVITSNKIQNGADAVAVYTADEAFANGTAITTTGLMDAFVYDTDDADVPDLLTLLNSGQPQVNENETGNAAKFSSQRYPNGSGDLQNTNTYVQALPTPGTINSNLTQKVDLVINETDADTPGSDTEEFIEIYDGGVGNVPLDGFILVFYNGSNDLAYNTFDLTGYTTNAQGYFVLGDANVKNVNYVVSNGFIQNGADAVALYKDSASNFPPSSALSTANLIDAVVYGTGDATDNELLALLNNGQLQLDEDANGNGSIESLQRIPNGSGGARNTKSFIATDPTPGYENGTLPPQTELLSIAEAKAAADNTTVTITGTITASDQFGGPAYIQDKSGGMAIYDAKVYGNGNFKIGDSITVTGTKVVYYGQIEINPVDRVDNEGTANHTITPVETNIADLANYKDKLVTIKNVDFAREDAGTLIFGNQNYTITDASGQVTLRIDANASELIGKAIPEGCETVTGIVGSYNNAPEFLVRVASDIPCAGPYDNSGEDSSISQDLTLDVAAWNIEWFGDETNSPAAGQPNSDEIQKNAVKEKILALNPDIIGVEEVSDVDLFAQMVSEMDGYDYVLSDATSYPNEPGGQRVGFIFKKDVVSVLKARAMFTSVHPYYNGGDDSLLSDYPDSDHTRFYASGRLPFMLEATVTVNGQTKQIDFVELHARANTSGEDQNKYDMRKYDVEVLKDSLDTYYANANVLILGDYNDDVDETVSNVSTTVSSYEAYASDTGNYAILTKALSENGFRSYVSSDNMIDHITVTNELADDYIDG
ncbi:MAG: lamin tail domain-containing protein, partial [Gillisia sp.]